jgi:hypothetical protein
MPRIPDSLSETTTITMRLPVKLTHDEVHRYGKENARLNQQLEATLREKKAAMDGFKERESKIKEEANRLTSAIVSEQEDRDVDCTRVLDWDLGFVRVTRKDTGDVIEDRALTQREKQTKMLI